MLHTLAHDTPFGKHDNCVEDSTRSYMAPHTLRAGFLSWHPGKGASPSPRPASPPTFRPSTPMGASSP